MLWACKCPDSIRTDVLGTLKKEKWFNFSHSSIDMMQKIKDLFNQVWKQKTSPVFEYMFSKTSKALLGITQVLWRQMMELCRMLDNVCVAKTYEICIKSTKCMRFIQALIHSHKTAILSQLLRAPNFLMGLLQKTSHRQQGSLYHRHREVGGCRAALQSCLCAIPTPEHSPLT